MFVVCLFLTCVIASVSGATQYPTVSQSLIYKTNDSYSISVIVRSNSIITSGYYPVRHTMVPNTIKSTMFFSDIASNLDQDVTNVIVFYNSLIYVCSLAPNTAVDWCVDGTAEINFYPASNPNEANTVELGYFGAAAARAIDTLYLCTVFPDPVVFGVTFVMNLANIAIRLTGDLIDVVLKGPVETSGLVSGTIHTIAVTTATAKFEYTLPADVVSTTSGDILEFSMNGINQLQVTSRDKCQTYTCISLEQHSALDDTNTYRYIVSRTIGGNTVNSTSTNIVGYRQLIRHSTSYLSTLPTSTVDYYLYKNSALVKRNKIVIVGN